MPALLTTISTSVELARCRRDLLGVGDVQLDRRRAVVVSDGGRVADARVDLARAAGKQLLGDRLADAAVGAGHESC